MRQSCGRGVAIASVAVLLLLLFTTNVAHAAAPRGDSQVYVLQRRVGSSGTWATMGEFSLMRSSPTSNLRLRSSLAHNGSKKKSQETAHEGKQLTEAQQREWASADVVQYRVARGSDDGGIEHGSGSCVAMISATPCSIVRGFDAVDSQTVVLREQLVVVPGPGVSVLSLQLISETNAFHSKMVNGDECDRSIIRNLFPVVKVQTELHLSGPTTLASKVQYKDLQMLAERDKQAEEKSSGTAAKAKTVMKRVRNADGEWEEREVPVVEEQGFIQKYWMYFVLPIAFSVIKNMAGGG